MDLLEVGDLSADQLFILRERIDGTSYRDIQSKWSEEKREFIRLESITTCISRGALGYRWEKGMNGGERPYLCPADMRRLHDNIVESAQNDAHLEATDVLDRASRLKLERAQKALTFLQKTNSPTLAADVDNYIIEPPSRSWLNDVLDQLDAAIKSRRYIDPKRWNNCSKQIIREYYTLHANIIKEVPRCLIVGADETMMSSIRKGKVVVPRSVEQALEEGLPDMPHITAMCSHTVTGKAFTPFIILKGLKNCPQELLEFVYSGLMYLASSPSGWQTRDTFFFWTLCFINEFSFYRKSLAPQYRDMDALLIMDGHTSRECPMALICLQARKIKVLILPSHSTHVMQMFDVSIAAPLKTYYGSAIKKYLHDMSDEGAAAPKIRHAAIEAFISAWSQACTYKNCTNGAIKTGTCPTSFDKVCESPFVKEIPQEDEERIHRNEINGKVSINAQIITESTKIREIDESLKRFDRYAHLCLHDCEGTYQTMAQAAVGAEHNGCKMLSPLPPFITNTDKIVYFN